MESPFTFLALFPVFALTSQSAQLSSVCIYSANLSIIGVKSNDVFMEFVRLGNLEEKLSQRFIPTTFAVDENRSCTLLIWPFLRDKRRRSWMHCHSLASIFHPLCIPDENNLEQIIFKFNCQVNFIEARHLLIRSQFFCI